jgi:uncharacterized hydrophobic protein (TIGR00271 family)
MSNLRDLWALPKEEHENLTYREVMEGLLFKGHNLWLLAAAMVIACIGLNAGNASALIGAMLISPLMGPVIGFAFALSIRDRKMAELSVENWLIMVSTSLAASTIFFFITPFHYSTAELDSFTQGTIFDVIIAFVGGVAGFLGIIRKEAIKVIAGVAVATACIPPLCTAGYGLAMLQYRYFFGGMYFFLINCFFIGLGTWVTSSYLGYQRYFRQDYLNRRRVTTWGLTIGIALLAPSFWMATQKWKDMQLNRKATLYLTQIQRQFPQLVMLRHDAFRKDGKRFLEISLLNDSSEVAHQVLNSANALDTTMHVIWHFAPDKSARETALLRKQLKRVDSLLAQQDSVIRQLRIKE